MKHFKIFLTIISLLILTTGCRKEVMNRNLENGLGPTVEVPVNVEVDNLASRGWTLMTMNSDMSLNGGATTTEVFDNEYPQLFMVTDPNGNIMMMARSLINSSKEAVTINAKSTADALMTMHPLISKTSLEDYDGLVRALEGLRNYDAYVAAVAASIERGVSVTDETNTEVMTAFQKVMKEVSDSINVGIERINQSKSSIPIYSFPLRTTTNGNTLTLQTSDWCPTYTGTVTSSTGEVKTTRIPTVSDLGIIGLLHGNRIGNYYGTAVNFQFYENESKTFDLKYDVTDLIAQIGSEILGIAGLPVDSDLLSLAIDAVREAIAMVSPDGYSWSDFSVFAGSKILEEVIDKLKSKFEELAKQYSQNEFQWSIYGEGYDRKAKMLKVLEKGLKFYSVAKDGINMAFRFYWVFNQEYNNLMFCTEYNPESGIGSCQHVIINKARGDNQEGLANTDLADSLVVRVYNTEEVTGSVYCQFIDEQTGRKYFKVLPDAYEGEHHEISVYRHLWHIGDYAPGQTLHMSAVAVNVDEEEISNKVTFTAKVKYPVTLEKFGGDEQIGSANTQLMSPLVVKAIKEDSYQGNVRIKFTKESTGETTYHNLNSTGYASYDWVLDDGENEDVQHVTAVAVNENGMELSETVTFSATIGVEIPLLFGYWVWGYETSSSTTSITFTQRHLYETHVEYYSVEYETSNGYTLTKSYYLEVYSDHHCKMTITFSSTNDMVIPSSNYWEGTFNSNFTRAVFDTKNGTPITNQPYLQRVNSKNRK